MQHETIQRRSRRSDEVFFAGRARKPIRACRLFPCCVCIVATLVGCSSEGPERVIVSGTVTYQDQPIESGRIHFLPTKGTKAPISGAEIVDGNYTVDAKGGVPVGTHKIKITARRVDPKYAQLGDSLPHELSDVGGPPMQQYIPEKYNVRTELEITIPPGSDKITKPFDLVD